MASAQICEFSLAQNFQILCKGVQKPLRRGESPFEPVSAWF